MQLRKEVNKEEKKTRAEINHVLYSHLIFILIAVYYIIRAYNLLYRQIAFASITFVEFIIRSRTVRKKWLRKFFQELLERREWKV